MRITKHIFLFPFLMLFLACDGKKKQENPVVQLEGDSVPVEYADFEIVEFADYKIVTVEDPWPNAEKTYRYLLAEKDAVIPAGLQYDEKVEIPVEEIVVTSTTHIPSLEILGEEKSLTGFPGLEYVSSEKTRALISEGKIKELGKNEALNTEILLELQPDVVVGFSIDGSNKSLRNIEKSGIPVVFNADWTEKSPLGKAEWIKFFGAFYNKTEEAIAFFNQIEKEYLEAKKLAENAISEPTVVAGSMYKDQWYLPYGDSWHAKFIKDAGGIYLFSDTSGSGSLSLSFEAVLEKAKDAQFWLGPAQFQSYEELINASPHYKRFAAFQERNIFTFSSVKGETGGVVFYELAPNRPDLVLKDLISILHPGLLPNYETTFYKPLQ